MIITITIQEDGKMGVTTDEGTSQVELVGFLEYAKTLIMHKKFDDKEVVQEVTEGE